MKKILSAVACLAIGSSVLIAGGDISEPVEEVLEEPQINLSDDTITNDNEVKYDGFYAGLAWSHTKMSEVFTSKGYGATLSGGYYFNQYVGVEARYTRTFSTYRDGARPIIRTGDSYENIGLFVKPMLPLTTGFSLYGLAGYGKSSSHYNSSKDYTEQDFQWGLGAKYELSNGAGLFVDYLNMHDSDNYGGLVIPDVRFSSVSVGLLYTF